MLRSPKRANSTPPPAGGAHGLPAGVLFLWALLAAAAVGVLVVYWRTPVAELYHVTRSGPGEALRRVLSFAGYPSALVAAAIAVLVADRLTRRTVVVAALGSVALGASALWLGTSDEAEVDAKPVSIAALTGLAIAIGLTILLIRRQGTVGLHHQRGDRRRLVAGLFVLAVSLPWLAALLGLSLDRVPLLGAVFVTDTQLTQPGNPTPFPAVHDGHHHGLDGAILLWSALVLSRELGRFRSRRLASGVVVLLSFFLAYGGWNVAQDFWLEQVVKRGVTTAEIPYAIAPAPTVVWALVLLLAAGAFLVLRPMLGSPSSAAEDRPG